MGSKHKLHNFPEYGLRVHCQRGSVTIEAKLRGFKIIKTRLTELLGIRHPIIKGAMAWVSFPELVAAVSNEMRAEVLL